MPHVSDILNVVLFADDACLSLDDADVDVLQRRMTSELILIQRWLVANKLSLNLLKTKYLIFTSLSKQHHTSQFNLSINDKPIERANSIRYLGVILDETLSFKQHIAKLRSKLSRNVGLLWKLRRVCGRKLLLQLYYVLVDSLISYANIVWCSTYKTTVNPLYILQKKALKIITYTNIRHSGQHLFKDLSVLSIYQLYHKQVALYMHDYYTETLPPALRICILDLRTDRATRRQHLGTPNFPICRTNFMRHSISFNGPKTWSLLPENITSIQNRTRFATVVKEYLIKNSATDQLTGT